MTMLKTAVIGVGKLGASHARWLKAISGSELVGVFDSDAERCAAVAADLQVTAFADVGSALDAADAVCIAAPTTTHHQLALAALDAGVHTLIEKPIAATLDEANEIVSRARERQRVLTVGHIERFNPAFLAIAGRELRPRFIEAHRLAGFNPRSTDIAVILDLMVHDIDLSLTLVGSRPKTISASAVPVITELADIANVRIEFENGAVANLTASRISLQPMRKMRIFERSGYYSLDFAGKSADVYTLADSGAAADGGGMRIPLGASGKDIVYQKSSVRAEEDMLKMELEAFLAAARGELPVVVSGEQATAALEVALEVERVAREGRLLE
ncbi:MAG TPA: Gfo/Idh/MocA family oxidoreductase [candidate division Zixibacteria bacterium]|nr:Gfo/Idh/MocA family oxidoreductase [candidate division Zixibacteria bacterium]